MTEPDALREAARDAERCGDWESAVRWWDAIVAETRAPTYWDRFAAARATLRSGRPEDAVERLDAIEIASRHEASWALLRAEIEEARGDDERAVGMWREAASLHEDPYWALFGLARSLNRLGRLAEARETMSAALALPSVEAGGLRFAASLDLRTGRHEAGDAKLASIGVDAEERAMEVLRSLPGMTTLDERLVLRRVAREDLSGSGAVVDLGCWLGSLTAAIALGLAENPEHSPASTRIHAYDNFVWYDSYMCDSWPDRLALRRPESGESFLPAFRALVGRWSHFVEVHEGDLLEARWDGGPIELLSVDAMKTDALARKIVSEFFPSLVPVHGRLFHQDFCHHYTWWIHLYHFLCHDHFEVLDEIPGSEAVLFRVVRPFKPSDIARVVGANLSDAGLAGEAFSYSLELVAAADRARIGLAYARCEVANGRERRAREILEKLCDEPGADWGLAWLP